MPGVLSRVKFLGLFLLCLAPPGLGEAASGPGSAGAMPSYDNSDNRTGSVSAYDLALYFSYGGRVETGFQPVPSFLYGAGFKHISQKLDTRKAYFSPIFY